MFSLNIFEGIELNTMQFIGPLVVLIIMGSILGILYRVLFSWLPKSIYNYLLGAVILMAIYLWAFPMQMGFYEFFR